VIAQTCASPQHRVSALCGWNHVRDASFLSGI